MLHRVEVGPLPSWLDHERLLGPAGEGEVWAPGADAGYWEARLERTRAADVQAQLRGIGLGGSPISVRVSPPLKRNAVREARTRDARARRATTPGFSKRGARLDEEGRWSLTPEALADGMAAHADPTWTVLDAGCGVGGNTLAFARRGCRVIAVERDPGRLAMARFNAGLYGVQERIEFVEGDASEFLGSRSADLVFMDPPWGVDWNRMRCGVDDFEGLAAQLRSLGAQRLWLKLPPSFDPSELAQMRPKPVFGAATGDRHRIKFLWLRGPSG